MKMSVRGSGMQSAREQRFAAYVDSLRRALNPVVLPQNLRGVAWPPAEPASAAP
jgi:hypothetical protein